MRNNYRVQHILLHKSLNFNLYSFQVCLQCKFWFKYSIMHRSNKNDYFFKRQWKAVGQLKLQRRVAISEYKYTK